MNTNKYYFPSSHDTIINYLLIEQTGAKFKNKLINPNVCYNSAFESSANKSKKIFSETFAMSLMYSKNNRGPRMGPCGTPHLIVNKLDLTPL